MNPDKGFLLIDKPAGITSFDVIRRLRKLTGIRRIGHCGTLDPFATGLLICALGNYTRLNSFLEARDKSYKATVLLGKSTLTGDTEGEIHEIRSVDLGRLDPAQLKFAALNLKELPVPAYSAVKIDGKRAYDLARAGQTVDLAARPTRITDFEVIELPRESDPDPQLTYSCTVSKGTYIRSLSEWIASQLDTLGYTVELRRMAIGDISVEDAVTLDSLSTENWHQHLSQTRGLFSHLESWQASQADMDALNNGQSFNNPGEENPVLMIFNPNGDLVGVASRTNGRIHPRVNLR